MLIPDDAVAVTVPSADSTADGPPADLRTEFVRVASHELRTPLTTIATFADMLAADGDVLTLDPTDRRSAIAAIRRNAERMQVVVADLMLLTELESADVPLHPGRIDLATLLTEAAGDARATLHVPPGPLLDGDEILLRQLFRTAIGVADIANDPGEPVRVEATHDAHRWTVLVEARTAAPLSAERLLSMRVPHPQFADEHQTGALALMLGREIAARHGGEMITSVERPGVRVRITLPLTCPAADREPG